MRKAAVGLAGGIAVREVWRRLRRIDLDGRVVVITGGSRGLGLELAREVARGGARLVLLARSEQELAGAWAELSGADLTALACDVRDRASVERVVDEVGKTYGRIDVLFNVAGVIDVAPLEHVANEDIRDSINTHVWGAIHTIQAALPWMPRESRIVNISSIGGLVPVPHLLSYTIGKFALTGFSEGLHAELAPRGIRVTTVCPGLMRTGSHVKARFRGRHEKEFAWFAASAGTPLTSMNARHAARKIVNACREGRPFLILTPQARMLHLFHALAPNTTARIMSAVARALPEGDSSGGDYRQEGWRSRSAAAPSRATHLADEAADRNQELSEEERKTYFDL